MAHPKPLERGQLERELQDLIRVDRTAISHALLCTLCDSRDVALHALALAGWTELEYLEDCARADGRRG